MGDTTWVYGTKGQYLGTINDKLKNQVHFVNNSNEKASPFDASKLSAKEAKSLAKGVRSTSVAFMGSKTASDMRTIVTRSDQYRKEVGFVGSIGKDREIRLTAMPVDENNSFNSVNIGKQLNKNYSPEQQAGFFLAGHTHEGALLNGFSYGSNMTNQMGLGEPSNHGDKSDYYPMLYQNGNISDRSQTPALIATPYGVTIYRTGTNSTGNAQAGTFIENKLYPSNNSYILYQSLKRKA
jgi:hypothetical protein